MEMVNTLNGWLRRVPAWVIYVIGFGWIGWLFYSALRGWMGPEPIIGHSSSEGADDYNRALSERRAASVVAALIGLGMNDSALSAVGRGEDEPIASNDDEAGRSLNRRVEVRCAG